MKIYRDIFYRVYSWNRKTWGKEDVPEQSALYTVSIVMGMNIGFILLLLSLLGLNVFAVANINAYAVFAMIMLASINYFRFIHKKKIVKLHQIYANELPNEKRKNIIHVWLFVLCSFISLTGTALLIAYYK